MTSRDTTGLLPRQYDAASHPAWTRAPSDWAWLLGIGAVQWPWLLRSLRGGSRAAKAQLLERLALAPDALPNLGSWKADTGLLTLLVDEIEARRPPVVVEFGAGASTLVLARALQLWGGGALTSFDQHPDFVALTRDWLAGHGLQTDLRIAPLAPSLGDWPGLWYDAPGVPERIDLLVIDGPPWTIHPLTRGAAATLFARIAPGGAVILDDAARPGERLVARRWRQAWPDWDWRLLRTGTKGTLVGRRPG